MPALNHPADHDGARAPDVDFLKDRASPEELALAQGYLNTLALIVAKRVMHRVLSVSAYPYRSVTIHDRR